MRRRGFFGRRLLSRIRGEPRRTRLGTRRAFREGQRLMESGEYAAAGDLYEELAVEASSQGQPQAAIRLNMQAARGSLLSGQTVHGIDLLRQGLSTLAEAGQWPALQWAGNVNHRSSH